MPLNRQKIGTVRESAVLAALREAFPELQAAWLFGSFAQGTAGPESDIDLAVLVPGEFDPVALWDTAQRLAARFGYDLDLIDFKRASTVLQHQIVTRGRRLWAADPAAIGAYEAFVLSAKTALDEARAGLLADIRRDGRVFRG